MAAGTTSDDYQALHFKKLWTIEDVALYLGRGVAGVRTMRRLGHLPAASKIDKRLYWIPGEVEQWIKDHREDDLRGAP
ncbi:MAG: helix-turn-helix transcriptional regulator [Streptosporangiaceae bacterium]